MNDITVPEAAAMLGVSQAYVRRLIAQGELVARRIGPATRGGQWLLDAAAVQQVSQARAQHPPRRGRPASKRNDHDHT